MTAIRIAKDEFAVNKRTATLWIPALCSLTISMGSLMILRRMGLKPNVVWVGRMPVLLYVPWLVLLPLAGTVGAFLSRRGGGRFLTCLTASLSPAVTMCGLVSLGLVLMSTSDLLDRPRWLYIVLVLFNWVVLPSVALLTGAAPFLSDRAPRI